MKKLHKKDQGTFGEALVVAQILEHGHAAFTDFGDNSSTDVIVEDSEGRLHRIQVKTVSRSSQKPECSELYLYKNGPNYSSVYKTGDVDWFAMIDMVTKQIAWIDATQAITESNSNYSSMTLRHAPTKNRQTKGIRMFEDYIRYPF